MQHALFSCSCLYCSEGSKPGMGRKLVLISSILQARCVSCIGYFIVFHRLVFPTIKCYGQIFIWSTVNPWAFLFGIMQMYSPHHLLCPQQLSSALEHFRVVAKACSSTVLQVCMLLSFQSPDIPRAKENAHWLSTLLPIHRMYCRTLLDVLVLEEVSGSISMMFLFWVSFLKHFSGYACLYPHFLEHFKGT